MPSYEFEFEIVNSRMRPIAEALVEKYEELRHISPDKILFVLNHKASGSKKKIVLATTAQISSKWAEILFQLGACSFFHSIEFHEQTTCCLDDNQMTALLYRELRTIGPEGSIIKPDTNEWWTVLMGLGRHWFYPDQTCPNLLDESVDWQKLMGSYYEDPRTNN